MWTMCYLEVTVYFLETIDRQRFSVVIVSVSQRTMWCLEQDQLWYLRNRRTKYALTVSYRRSGKLRFRSNSLPFCVVYRLIGVFIGTQKFSGPSTSYKTLNSGWARSAFTNRKFQLHMYTWSSTPSDVSIPLFVRCTLGEIWVCLTFVRDLGLSDICSFREIWVCLTFVWDTYCLVWLVSLLPLTFWVPLSSFVLVPCILVLYFAIFY